jgi:DNA-binding beta-propeller fold protein YncE
VATIPLGASGHAVAAGDNSVWAVLEDGRVVRVDPAANAVIAALSTPRGEWPPLAAIGFGALWLSVPNPNSLLRVNLQANGVVATIPVGHSPEGIAFGFGSVWVANHRSDAGDPRLGPTATQGTYSISRVDPSTNRESARIPVEVREHPDPWIRFCCGPQGITVAAGAVWTADANLRAVVKVDPDTNRAVATIPITLGDSCGGMTGDDAAVWLASGCNSSTVVRIDPRTNSVVATIDVISTTRSVALGGGNLWVSTSRELVRIDPVTNRVRGRTILPNAIRGMAYGAGAIWITAGTDLLRIEPVAASR